MPRGAHAHRKPRGAHAHRRKCLTRDPKGCSVRTSFGPADSPGPPALPGAGSARRMLRRRAPAFQATWSPPGIPRTSRRREMRKHRRFGVVIAVLLGMGLAFQQPSSAHHQPVNRATGLGRLDLQLVSASIPAGDPPTAASAAPEDPALLDAVHPVTTHQLLVQQAIRAYLEAQAPRPTPPPSPRPAPPPPPAPVVAASSGDVWAALRQCESGGNYADNTGNGYYGAYQFSLATWQGLGMSGLPSDAPPAVQDQAAHELQARSGWGQWPACSRRLNLV